MTWDWTPETAGRLESFLRARDLMSGAPQMQRIGDGHSNLTYLVGDGERNVIVRRPPPPPVLPGAHDVLREARLIQALTGTGVPVAKVFAIGQQGDVFDVPFYVMEYVQGVVINDETPKALATPAYRRGIAEALVDRLIDLHMVDWRTRGLEDFGRPEGFNRRHLRRIGGLVADQHGNPPSEFAEIRAWLEDKAPEESGSGIVHNDYRLGNVMWATQPPVNLLAILDWELATIGDPLLDVGYFLASYPQPGEPLTPTQELARAVLEPGYPSRAELAERYASRTGRNLSNINWYIAMCEWKLAILYEYSRRRGDDAYYADPNLARRFLAAAHRAAGLGPILDAVVIERKLDGP
jgi:aminoglycoside phosphotransferase (APT) family kinase protein